jgi:hypothetical protein
MAKAEATKLKRQDTEPFDTPTDLSREGVTEISTALRQMLADVFALYLKTKNFHWHMSGRHFRDYHLLLDEHSDQIFAMSDDIAERARKIARSDQSAMSHGISDWKTIMKRSWTRRTCSLNSPQTISSSLNICARLTKSASGTMTLRRPA